MLDTAILVHMYQGVQGCVWCMKSYVFIEVLNEAEGRTWGFKHGRIKSDILLNEQCFETTCRWEEKKDLF